jgi:ribonucleoside-diphosphate reductase alpha chain
MTTAYWLNADARTFLSRDYLAPGQSAEDRIKVIAEASERWTGRKGLAARVERYILNGWCSLSSPIWSNFGFGENLPISCNGSFIPDDTAKLYSKVSEIAMMTKYGAGVSGFMGAIRGRGEPIRTGGTSDGSAHLAYAFESTIDLISQNKVRRGSGAFYWPIDHKDIEEVLEFRHEGSSIQNLFYGVSVSTSWLSEMRAGDKAKRKTWAKVLKNRAETGIPYLFFHDNANNGKPQVYKDLDMTIWASNLCTEIMEPSSEDESFVCDLLSLNDLHFNEWKNDPLFVQDMTWFLDGVMSEYIEKVRGRPHMDAAYNFAIRHRALGLGRLGWHSFLQSKNIAFESMEARKYNVEIQQFIDEQSLIASKEMAIVLGEPEYLIGRGLRNTVRQAIAPTTSSSFILGQVSPSVEPEQSNYYVKVLAKGKFTYRNPYLKKRLVELGRDTEEVWTSILMQEGSVQHLDFLSEHDKNVFKTFGEISQYEIIVQAAERQVYIDQGQSINLMIHPKMPVKDVNALVLAAHDMGLKSLYYQRSTSPVAELNRNLVACVSCEA